MRYTALVLALFLGCALIAWTQPINPPEIPKKTGDQCLAELRGTQTIDPNGRIRFLLRQRGAGYEGAVLAVEADRFNKEFYLCRGKPELNGAIPAVIGVTLDGGPVYSGAHDNMPLRGSQFVATFGGSRSHFVTEKKESYLNAGLMIAVDEQFGLDRYRVVFGFKDKKVTSNTAFLGAEYYGHAPSGNAVNISCVDFDLTKMALCHLNEQLSEHVTVSIGVPPEHISRWREYIEITEKYYDGHREL